jgi:hypothetical protein
MRAIMVGAVVLALSACHPKPKVPNAPAPATGLSASIPVTPAAGPAVGSEIRRGWLAGYGYASFEPPTSQFSDCVKEIDDSQSATISNLAPFRLGLHLRALAMIDRARHLAIATHDDSAAGLLALVDMAHRWPAAGAASEMHLTRSDVVRALPSAADVPADWKP